MAICNELNPKTHQSTKLPSSMLLKVKFNTMQNTIQKRSTKSAVEMDLNVGSGVLRNK